jgi:type I restriction enzyme S subunit
LSTLRLKHVCDVIDARAGSRRPPLLAVSIHRGVVPRDEFTDDEPRADDLSMYRLCEPGDIVLNRMRAFQGAVGMAPVRGLVSPDYLVLRPCQHALGRYLHYLFRSSEFVSQMIARLRGIGSTNTGTVRTPRINADDLLSLDVRMPSVDEQRAIADYLDRETARIDALVVLKGRILELAAARWQTEVTGMTRATEAASDRPDLPRGWTMVALRRCLDQTDYGIGFATSAEGAYPVLAMTNIQGGEITGDVGGYVDEVDPCLMLVPGDLLFNRTNSRELVGKVGIVRQLEKPTTFASYLVRLRANDRVMPEYLNCVLNSPPVLGIARSLALPSIGQANLNPSRYSAIKIPLPPMGEQTEIITVLDKQRLQLRSLEDVVGRQIALLHERRRALITSTVTGEVAVRAPA